MQNWIDRHLAVALHRALQQEQPVALTGPRGAGKTALARRELPRHIYIDLTHAADRARARQNPETFLRRLRGPAIFDEAHRAPELIDAVQREPVNHLLIAPLRLGARDLHLLPFSLAEREGRSPVDPLALGHAPAHRPLPRQTLARALETSQPDERALERDLQTVVRPHDLDRVLALLHELRNEAIIDQTALARTAGVTHPTVARWLDALERLFVIATVPALEEDFGQRTVKRRKLFFLDPAWLSAENRFLAFAATEIWKSYWHRGLDAPLAHWKTGSAQAALVLENTLALSFAAIPAAPSGTVESLKKWKMLAPHHHAALVNTGRHSVLAEGIAIQPWFAL